MKKFFIAIFCMLAQLPLQALPVTNPIESALYPEGLWIKNRCDPEDLWYVGDCFDWCHTFSVRFGYWGNFVFNRNLQIQGEGFNGQGKVIQETNIHTNAGILVFNFCEMVDLFATLGKSRMRLYTSERSWNPAAGAEGTLLTDSHISWSVGGKVAVFHWNCLDFGFEGQYFQASPNFTQYISSFVGNYVAFDTNNDFKYREWQLGAVMAYTWLTRCPDIAVSPYVAAKWAHFQMTTHNFRFIAQPSGFLFTIFDLKSHKSWGFAIGTTLVLYDVAGITVEGRFGDERAFHVNAQFCF